MPISIRAARAAAFLSLAIPLAIPLAVAAAFPAAAHDYKVGALTIAHPWSRATPPSATIGAGYLTVSNPGTTQDRLVGASSPAAEKVELHEMSVTDGIMRMARVDGGLAIPPGGSVALQPGGLHLMLVGLSKPLVEGERVPLTLTFEKAGTIAVDLAVDRLGATVPSAPATGGPSGHEGHGADAAATAGHAHGG